MSSWLTDAGPSAFTLLVTTLCYTFIPPPQTVQPPLFADQKPCVRTDKMPPHLRLKDYQSPTPDCVPNAYTVNTVQVQQLIAERNPLLLDVAGAMERNDPDFGHEWLPNEPRYSLPNAVWLPNVGRGVLEPALQTYLVTQLKKFTNADWHKPIVVFCIADCWMSWNAAQRLHGLGYVQVYWYKGGTDDWREAKLPIKEVEPVPMESATTPSQST